MNLNIASIIAQFEEEQILPERKIILRKLIDYIQDKRSRNESIRLNFICTHNSRRSHLAQIWAQTMAFHAGIKDITCYSGGTEVTALFPKVVDTLLGQGFDIQKLSDNLNPVYGIKFDRNEAPIIGFSKKYNDGFNPQSNYVAILTCHSADEACPAVLGAEARIAITYEDPKKFDNTDLQSEKYIERSLQIARELWWVFRSLS